MDFELSDIRYPNGVEIIGDEDIEFKLLLEAVFIKYGYDFREYSPTSLKRQVARRMDQDGIGSISEFQHRVIYDEAFFKKILLDFSINVTELFRDPEVYLAIRKEIVPILRTYPSLKIWHAGCATGQEVYSIAIMLKEEGLYDRCQIYATDINQDALAVAKEGIYSKNRIKEDVQNYLLAGGKSSLADYYTANYGHLIMKRELKKNILFMDHNLATDGSIGEMQLILCRNVFLYFREDLQRKVVSVFNDSLCPGGFLCMGARERLFPKKTGNYFREFLLNEKVYRKGAG